MLTLKEARSPGPADVAEVENCSARIVDRVGRILKVEAPDLQLEQLSQQMPSWHVQPEVEYRVPDTRRLIDKTKT